MPPLAANDESLVVSAVMPPPFPNYPRRASLEPRVEMTRIMLTLPALSPLADARFALSAHAPLPGAVFGRGG